MRFYIYLILFMGLGYGQFDWKNDGAPIRQGLHIEWQRTGDADSDGSIEALAESLEKIKNDEVGIDIVHKGVGNVTESDVLLAEASNAVVLGFNVQIPSNTRLQANQSNVEQ